MKTIIEIRAAEGGEDSKLLVKEMTDIYQKAANLNNFKFKLENTLPGFASIWIDGRGSYDFFKNESGSHKWQRVPPTEKRGRVQTSTVTVAVMQEEELDKFILNKNDVERKYTRSGGKGGQHVNKTESCVILIHKPSGIIIRSEETRVQFKNEELAWKRLEDKLKSKFRDNQINDYNKDRFDQIGLGNRSDKKRTYRIQDGIIIDHVSGKQISVRDLYKGKLGLLH